MANDSGSTGPDSLAGDFQRSTRMPLDAVVRLHFEGTVAYQNGFAANVSASGMFVKHPAPPPIGTPLVFEFNLGQQRKPVQGAGEVVWVRDRYLGPGQPAGVGIRFTSLDTQSRDHIAEALFEYLEQSLTEEAYYDSDRLADEIGAPAGELEGLPTPAERTAEPEEALDLASVPPLPRATQPVPEPVEPESRQAFEVFSPIDRADPKTAAIVRDALRDEPQAIPPLAPFAGAAATREGGRSPAWWIVPLLLLVGAGGWFAWQTWGDRLTGSSEAAAPVETPPPAPLPEPLSGNPGTGTTLAETVGVDPSERSPAADPPATAGESASSAPAEPVEITEAAPEPAPAVAESAEPAAAPLPGGAAASRITDLAWRDAEGGAELVIRGDGPFGAGRYSYSEIGGENPRVLIRMRGMESPFRGSASGSTPLARGVRTGFHVNTGGNEIHLVVDLARPAARVASLAATDDGLLLRLSAR
ncbi:MAG: PilZ domain-containing protein [Thermoanaerobaculia bacterium]